MSNDPTRDTNQPADNHTLGIPGRSGNASDEWPAAPTAVGGVTPVRVPRGTTEFMGAAEESDEIGRLKKYRILREIGRGGMGVVYEAEDTLLRRRVAIKYMLPEVAASPENRQRFISEARAVAKIDHDNVVPVFEADEANGLPFMVMPLLKGETLDARIHREKKLPLTEVMRIIREITRGLAEAHKHQLVHRDIKPKNIWLDASTGRSRILDFGLARNLAGTDHNSMSGQIQGTAGYMSPEQAAGESVDHRTDLFSVGCMLYEMTTGRAPFSGSNFIALLSSLATQIPVSPIKLNPDLPQQLSDLTDDLLVKNPDKRINSAERVIEMLDFLIGSSITGATARRKLIDPSSSHPVIVLPDETTVEYQADREDSDDDDSDSNGNSILKKVLLLLAGCFALIVAAGAILFFAIRDNDQTPPTEETPTSKTTPATGTTPPTSPVITPPTRTTKPTSITIPTSRPTETITPAPDTWSQKLRPLDLAGISAQEVASRNPGRRGDRDTENRKQFAAEEFHRAMSRVAPTTPDPDWAEALKFLQSAAELHHPEAAYYLGRAYQYGLGTPINPSLAVQWYQVAAASDSVSATAALGLLECEGVGLQRNLVKGKARIESILDVIIQRANQGGAAAQTTYGIMLQHGYGQAENIQEAVRWYRKAADAGDLLAISRLAMCYLDGTGGVEASDTEAFSLFQTAAKAGFPIAAYNLGYLYSTGKGTTQDDAEMIRWMTQAAESGLADAQIFLGGCYFRGRGVPKDVAASTKWYQQAADGYRVEALTGNPRSQYYLGQQYEIGLGVKQDSEEAVKWFRLSADQDYAKAQASLGKAYELGNGVTRNLKEAVMWYKKAADQGDKNAKEALERLNN